MATPKIKTFIIDCHNCRAKVAAIETGRAERRGWIKEAGEPYGEKLLVGSCPSCGSLLAGETTQIGFENYNSDEDQWSDVVRVYPRPPKAFSSYRIPREVKDSLLEADRSLQANANIAACAMFGRALEAICRDILKEQVESEPSSRNSTTEKPKNRLMLGEGIKKLRDKKIIDDRLHDWSQQLHAFRNIAAHPEAISISRDDTEDLQTFVYAIIEYIYDLADRYTEFKERKEQRARRKKS